MRLATSVMFMLATSAHYSYAVETSTERRRRIGRASVHPRPTKLFAFFFSPLGCACPPLRNGSRHFSALSHESDRRGVLYFYSAPSLRLHCTNYTYIKRHLFEFSAIGCAIKPTANYSNPLQSKAHIVALRMMTGLSLGLISPARAFASEPPFAPSRKRFEATRNVTPSFLEALFEQLNSSMNSLLRSDLRRSSVVTRFRLPWKKARSWTE